MEENRGPGDEEKQSPRQTVLVEPPRLVPVSQPSGRAHPPAPVCGQLRPAGPATSQLGRLGPNCGQMSKGNGCFINMASRASLLYGRKPLEHAVAYCSLPAAQPCGQRAPGGAAGGTPGG